MKTYYFLFLICLHYSILMGQVGIGGTPNPASQLDVQATDKGFILPRVSLNNITDSSLDGTNSSPEGMIIYNTNDALTGGNGKGLYFFNGTQWEKLTVNSRNVNTITIDTGDITKSNTSGEDVAGYDTAIEPSIYNKDGKIQIKLVVRYISNNATNVNFQLRAHDLANEVYPIVNADFGTHASVQSGFVATSDWKNWDAGTNAYEIHLFDWVDSGSITIKSAYLLVRSQ